MNQGLTPTNPERELKKRNEYEAFVLWYSLPTNFRGLDDAQLKEMGVEEEHFDILKIKTQGEFAKKFRVGKDALTDWKKRSHFDKDIKNLVDKELFQKFYAKVMYAFTMQTIKYGDAQRFMTWMKMFAGHTEVVDVNINEEININGNSILEGQSIMDVVMARLKHSGRIENESQMKEIASEIEDVKYEELPSQNQYDFDSIASKQTPNAPERVEDNIDTDQVKNKLAESLKKLQQNKKK